MIARLTLPGVERSVREARVFVRDILVPRHLAPGDERLDDLTLVVSELAGNGIRHTGSGRGGKFSVVLLAGRGLIRAEVTDDGAAGARPQL